MSTNESTPACPEWCGKGRSWLPKGAAAYHRKGRVYHRKRCLLAAAKDEKASPTPAVPGVPAFRRETVMAWLLDRVHARYDNESGYIAFIERMVDGIRAGEVEAAFEHGELDDILRRLR